MSDNNEKKEEAKKEKPTPQAAKPRRKRKKGAAAAVKIPTGKRYVHALGCIMSGLITQFFSVLSFFDLR